MKKNAKRAIWISALLFVMLLAFAVIALSFIIPTVGWRPMKNLELTKAVHYYGPLKQYTFSEEETAEIEQQLRSLVVYGERKDAEPMDGYAGYYLLTDKKGRSAVSRS